MFKEEHATAGMIDRGNSSARVPLEIAPVVPERVAPRPARRYILPKLVNAAADGLALAIAMVLAYEVGGIDSLRTDLSSGEYAIFGFVGVLVWLLVFARYGLYAARRITGRIQESRAVFNASVMGAALLAVGVYATDLNIARRWVLLTFVFGLACVMVERELIRRAYGVLRRNGRFLRRVVIVGANEEGRAIGYMLSTTPSLGYRVVGYVDDTARSNGVAILGSIRETLAVCQKTNATGAIVATTSLEIESANELVRQLIDHGVHVELSSSLRDIASERLVVRPLGAFPVVYLEPVHRKGWRAVAKRAFDLTFASVALLLLSPLLLGIAIAIKIDSPGPVLFRQRRLGINGRPFTIYKFRTMVVDAEDLLADLHHANEADGPLFKMREDPRVTRVGRFLRRVSFDELAQFINVVRNEMSVVGPRPALPSEAESWEPKLRQRLRVKPGLTGMWQVHGRSDSSFEEYSRLDLYYVDNWSLITDIGIVLRTIPTLLRRDGAY